MKLQDELGLIRRWRMLLKHMKTDFLVLETHGLEGHATLKKYRVSKQLFTEAHVSFEVKKQSFLLEPLSELTLWVLQVTHNALTPFLILCIQT